MFIGLSFWIALIFYGNAPSKTPVLHEIGVLFFYFNSAFRHAFGVFSLAVYVMLYIIWLVPAGLACVGYFDPRSQKVGYTQEFKECDGYFEYMQNSFNRHKDSETLDPSSPLVDENGGFVNF